MPRELEPLPRAARGAPGAILRTTAPHYPTEIYGFHCEQRGQPALLTVSCCPARSVRCSAISSTVRVCDVVRIDKAVMAAVLKTMRNLDAILFLGGAGPAAGVACERGGDLAPYSVSWM